MSPESSLRQLTGTVHELAAEVAALRGQLAEERRRIDGVEGAVLLWNQSIPAAPRDASLPEAGPRGPAGDPAARTPSAAAALFHRPATAQPAAVLQEITMAEETETTEETKPEEKTNEEDGA